MQSPEVSIENQGSRLLGLT